MTFVDKALGEAGLPFAFDFLGLGAGLGFSEIVVCFLRLDLGLGLFETVVGVFLLPAC